MAYDYAKRYLSYFDDVYAKNATSRILETPSMAYEFLGVSQILVNTITVDGASDYSRTTGYASGSVANSYVAYDLSMDRGVKFSIDAMDLDEAQITSAKVMNTYLTTKFFPELDKYRYSKIYTDLSGSSLSGTNIVEATLTSADILSAIEDGINVLNEAEVPKDNRVIFITETMYSTLMKSSEIDTTRVITEMSNVYNREITKYNGHVFITVPTDRFNSAYTFGAGTITATGEDMNFMIVHLPAILAVIKRNVLRMFSPEQNQDSDGWLMVNRLYHDLHIFSNKFAGTYIHKKAVA